MEEKPLTTIVYLTLGLCVILLPMLVRKLQEENGFYTRRFKNYPYITIFLLACDGILVTWLDAAGNYKLAVSWILVACLAALATRHIGRSAALGFVTGLALASILPWWLHTKNFIDISSHDLVGYAGLNLIVLFFLGRQFVINPNVTVDIKWKRAAILIFMAPAFYLSFTTGMAQTWQTFGSWWHHWGAYIGPAELLLSGAHILTDFPAQYGVGPSVAIALACHQNCWVAMYYIVGIATFLFSLFILSIVLAFDIRSKLALIVLPILTIAACFSWNSFGPAFSSPILFPSVAGLRFTPVAALVAALCFCEQRQRLHNRWKLLGHFLWAIAAVWSPESLYIASFVWWPYYCWRMSAEREWRQGAGCLRKSNSVAGACVLADVLRLRGNLLDKLS